MEIDLLAGCIRPLLAVEPCIEKNCFTTAYSCVLCVLHLCACQQECSDALRIVADSLLAGVIVVAAVAVLISAEAGGLDDCGERDRIYFGCDEMTENTTIGALGIGQIALRK